MRIAFASIPPEIVEKYGLARLQHNIWVYMEIRNGMPGLKQDGRIANDRLINHLAQFGYAPVRHTPSLWCHETRDIIFSLVVDDFGVKYVGKKNAEHLWDSLRTSPLISSIPKIAEYYAFLIHCSGVFGEKRNIGNTSENFKCGNLMRK